jgi:hypothetical protein
MKSSIAVEKYSWKSANSREGKHRNYRVVFLHKSPPKKPPNNPTTTQNP